MQPATVPGEDALVLVADTFQRNLNPPDYARSEEFLAEAIRQDPLRSDLWMRLARARLYQGKNAPARQALLRSDILDPHFPRQRLEAIQLWALLDDRARAEAIALKLASLDFSLLLDSAKSLRLAGWNPSEIFLLLKGPTLPAKDMGQLLIRIRSQNPETMRTLYANVPDSAYTDESFRQIASQEVANPLLIDIADRLWKSESDAIEAIETSGTLVLVDNPSLQKNPFENPFPFGWQPPTTLPWVEMRWNKPTSDAVSGGIVVSFINSSDPSHRSFNWPAYRLPVPANTPLRIRLFALIGGNITTSRCALAVSIPDMQEIRSPSSKVMGQIQTLEVNIPPLETPKTAVIYFAWSRQAGGDGLPVEITLGPLEVH